MTTVMAALARREHQIRDAIVRVEIDLPAHGEGMIQEAEIHRALREAYFVVPPAVRVERVARIRLGDAAAERMTPLEALRAYLETKKVSAGRASTLMEYGERLIGEEMGEAE